MHHEKRKAVINPAHPEPREAKEADPMWVEQEGASCCLKLPASLTINSKVETFAGESQEEGAKRRAGWLVLLFWRRMHTKCQAGTTTSVTRDTAGFVHRSPPLMRFGQGCGCAHPVPGNARSRQSLLPSKCQGCCLTPGSGVFLGKRGCFWSKSGTNPRSVRGLSENTLGCLFRLSGMS